MSKAGKSIHKVVFVRHGQSAWNLENRFTGWKDVDLTQKGVEEAKEAGKNLREHGFTFDVGFTSVLKRAIRTYNVITDELDVAHIPVSRSYRLNERHYGALTGLNKTETAQKHGEEQVLIWRRSYDIPPPPLDLNDERHPRFDERYKHLPDAVLPSTESLKITVDRVLPYWFDTICPLIKEGKKVLIVAHGNSLRAIVKYISNMGEKEIIKYNIPTAVPLVYEFDDNLKVLKNYFLLDEEELKKRQNEVAHQGKA